MCLEGGYTQYGVVEISKDPASGGKHGNAAVFDFSFTEKKGPFGGFLRELQGIEVLEFRSVVVIVKQNCNE